MRGRISEKKLPNYVRTTHVGTFVQDAVRVGWYPHLLRRVVVVCPVVVLVRWAEEQRGFLVALEDPARPHRDVELR